MPTHAKKHFQTGLESIGIQDGQHILIALSGGADSVALLRLFCETAPQNRFLLTACHVNHGIRGTEAERDENFCKQLCEKLDIPLHCVRVDVPAAAKEKKRGLEETARELRYHALQATALQNGCDLIATAHNADDHLETVLFHLARGSGSRGMQGIAPMRENVIRPLLYCTKNEILAYLTSIKQPYVTDSTNSDTNYTRNYIRQTILPAMRHLNPEAARASLAMSAALREDEAYITADLPANLPSPAEMTSLPNSILYRLLAREYMVAGGRGATREHFAKLTDLIHKGKTGDRLCLPGSITVKREKMHLVFVPTVRAEVKSTPDTVKHKIFRETDSVSSQDPQVGVVSFQMSEKVYNLAIKSDVSCAILDGELYWRHRQSGDTIRFGGMTRQIKKLLWQTGLSPKERDLLPIVCDDKGPLWVPGFPVRDDMRPNGSDHVVLVYIPGANNQNKTK